MKPQSRRRVDYASLTLLLVGLLCGAYAYGLITESHLSPLLLIPSVATATVGATHLTKREARR